MTPYLSPRLPSAGARIGVVDGPGQSPADRTGIVMVRTPSPWGGFATVLMDDGSTRTCSSVDDGPGIGWHSVAPRAHRRTA